jgi:hypothetical protein
MSLTNHIKLTRKRESVTESVQGYRGNCASGFTGAGVWEAHHILCLSSMGRRRHDYPKEPAELADYLEACLWVTPWDINDSRNLVGLPMKKQYHDTDGEEPEDLPCHNVDHGGRDGYTDEVSSYLKENVWRSLTAKKEVHDVDVAKLQDLLEKTSEGFRKLLAIRGKRPPRTKLGWKNRYEKGYEHIWYHPFSMSKNPGPRSSGVAQRLLETVLKKIKLSF